MARRRRRRVFHRWNNHVAPVFSLWCALVCKAGSHGGAREWEGRGKGYEECDRVKGYGSIIVFITWHPALRQL